MAVPGSRRRGGPVGTTNRPGGRREPVGAVEPHGIHVLHFTGPVVGCLRASESRQNTGKGGYAEKISPHIMTYMMEAVI